MYGAMNPVLARFASSTPKGAFTLPQLVGASHGVTLLAVVIAALAAFRAAERWETRRSLVDA
jgi:hypothetical protein